MRLPLKFKLMGLLGALLLGALAFYVSYAVGLFQSDKAAYVYEAGLTAASSAGLRLEQELRLRDRQRAKQKPVHEAEQRRIRTDAKRERERSDAG